MATQLKERPQTRSERLVVLVSPREKRAIEQNAREGGMSLSDFVRTAAQNYGEPTSEERAELEQLFEEMRAADARSDATLVRLEELEKRAKAYDADAHKAELTKAWTNPDGSTNWAAIRRAFGSAGFGE